MLPDFIIKARFVVVGAALLRQLWQLLRRTEHPVPRAAIHSISGLVTLLLGNALGSLAGVGLGVNLLTVPVSAILGAPGVALLWGLRYVL